MILAGLIVSSFNGKITTLSDTILSSSKEAVELCILMFGIVGLWSGLMNIALSLGITTQLQKLLTPFLTFLFPKLKNQKAKEYISTNIVANILGLGWAATPSGLKAMEELQKPLYELSAAAYQQAQQAQQQAGGAGANAQQQTQTKDDDNVVDADFKDVTDK